MAGLTIDMTNGVYRKLYQGLCTGRRINAVSLKAFCVFWHCYMLADDFGNLSGDPHLIKSHGLPYRKEISRGQIPTLIDELAFTAPPLLMRYRVKDEDYIHISDFERLQPAGKNGRRIRRVPPPLVNPGESGGIQGNPGNPKKSSPAHAESDSDSDMNAETESDAESEADAGGASPKGARKASSPSLSPRLNARVTWLARCDPLFGKGDQRRRDHLAAAALFDDTIWPADDDEKTSADMFRKALEIVRRSTGTNNRMAYVTRAVFDEAKKCTN